VKNEVLQSTAEEVSCHKTGNKDNAAESGIEDSRSSRNKK